MTNIERRSTNRALTFALLILAALLAPTIHDVIGGNPVDSWASAFAHDSRRE